MSVLAIISTTCIAFFRIMVVTVRGRNELGKVRRGGDERGRCNGKGGQGKDEVRKRSVGECEYNTT